MGQEEVGIRAESYKPNPTGMDARRKCRKEMVKKKTRHLCQEALLQEQKRIGAVPRRERGKGRFMVLQWLFSERDKTLHIAGNHPAERERIQEREREEEPE